MLVGCLFIFSGLVKAIDPLGLAYKMQEFFEVWSDAGYLKSLMMWLHSHSVLFSVTMISLEVVLGISLLLGTFKKLTAWLLLLLMLLFTFLTSYVLFSGKIRACGCFGDCIPLTPKQTFTKDVILLLLVIVILFGQRYIKPLFSSIINYSVLAIGVIGVILLQWYVLKHLPLKDCLPYKVGNDIFRLRQMPENAVQDKYAYSFIYEKDGIKKEFTKDLPDSSWKYVDRIQTLVEKGHDNIPLINDFTFTTESGNDTTEAILTQPGEYYLLFIKTMEDHHLADEDKLINNARSSNSPVYVITAQPDKVREYLAKLDLHGAMPPIFTCDATAIKTAARADPTVFLMKGPVVQKKLSWADFDKVFKK